MAALRSAPSGVTFPSPAAPFHSAAGPPLPSQDEALRAELSFGTRSL